MLPSAWYIITTFRILLLGIHRCSLSVTEKGLALAALSTGLYVIFSMRENPLVLHNQGTHFTCRPGSVCMKLTTQVKGNIFF